MMLGILGMNIDGLLGIFTIFAVLGTVTFVLKTALQFIGGDLDLDTEVGAGDMDISDSEHGFKVLSIHGLSAFFMIFGLAGRALLIDTEFSNTLAVIFATMLGLFATWITAKMFTLMTRLQSIPNESRETAVGSEAGVYLSIPEGGIGKIRVNIGGRLKVMDATAEDGSAIGDEARVRVVGVREDGIFIVKE